MTQLSFQDEFTRLNPAQRAAAEATEGPLLIVAGPGTGKTQTVALRLANILQTTQAKPQNLLALTFTEAGAVALKTRLAKIVGSAAYGITATTFHSFCQQLIGMFPVEFAGRREKTPIDALGQFKLLRELLAAGDFRLLFNFRSPDLFIRDAGARIQTLKREGITPGRFAEIVAEEEKDLDDERWFKKKTDEPLKKRAAAVKQVARLRELAQLYADYQTALAERDLADFDDLILSVTEKLKSPDGDTVLAYLQEQFQYVTVDEFQDTNGAQNALLAAWAGDDDTPNLCAVGDDDQSIYRFQGASVANMLDFTQSYPSAEIVTLTTNYRSTQQILDTAGSLITHNTERLVGRIPELTKDLTAAGNPEEHSVPKDDTARPLILTHPDELAEAADIADRIKKLVDTGTNPADIAVLFRQRRDAERIAAALATAGVPHTRTDGANALHALPVRQLITLLTAIANPADVMAATSVLFSSFTQINPADAVKLARASAKRRSLLDFLADEKEFEKFTAQFRAEDTTGEITVSEQTFFFHDPRAIRDFAQIFLELQRDLHTLSVVELVESVTARSGLSAELATSGDLAAITPVTAFIQFVRRWNEAHVTGTLTELLADLKLMQEHGIPVSFRAAAADSVTLSTAHGAKGLEWEHVFLVGAVDPRWGGRPKPEKLKLPELVTRHPEESVLRDAPHSGAPQHDTDVSKGDPKNALIEDERRLFFVALTRARQSLTVSAPNSIDSRAVAPSRFLAELAEETVAQEQVEGSSSEAAALGLPQQSTLPLDADSKAFLTELVAHYRLSPSGLNSYLTCPQQFLFTDLLRLPRAVDAHTEEVLTFGTVTHRALEVWFAEYKKRDALPPVALATEELKAALARTTLPQPRQERLGLDATQDLQGYLAHHGSSVQPPLFVEMSFGRFDVHLDDIPLTGKADRIDLVDDTQRLCRIVDYKTKTPKTENQIRSDENDYRQLVFYQLLTQLSGKPFGYTASEVALSFTRPNDHGEYRDAVFRPTEADLTTVKDDIRQAATGIRALDFAPTASEKCKYCPLAGWCEAAQ